MPQAFFTGESHQRWVPKWDFPQRVEFHYSTRHIFGDTLRERLRDGFTFSIIAELTAAHDDVIVFDPIVMGASWLESVDGEYVAVEWYGSEFYEHFIEDFDEFSKVKAIPEPPNPEPMRRIAETAFKACLSEILGDAKTSDWGGESSDY